MNSLRARGGTPGARFGRIRNGPELLNISSNKNNSRLPVAFAMT